MTKGVFVRPKDYQKLMGFENYNHAQKQLKYICNSLEKEQVTIRELCKYLGITREDYDEHTK